MGTILSRVKLNKKHIISLLLFMLLASVAEMMLPTLLAGMIDNGIGGNSRAVIFTVAIVMEVMAFLACIVNITATKLSAKISTKFAANIRHEIFYQMQSFSSAEMDKFGMAQLMKGRTSFVIADRLSTIKDADIILYMENGDIKEAGAHDELMKLNGKYAVLYNSQFA